MQDPKISYPVGTHANLATHIEDFSSCKATTISHKVIEIARMAVVVAHIEAAKSRAVTTIYLTHSFEKKVKRFGSLN